MLYGTRRGARPNCQRRREDRTDRPKPRIHLQRRLPPLDPGPRGVPWTLPSRDHSPEGTGFPPVNLGTERPVRGSCTPSLPPPHGPVLRPHPWTLSPGASQPEPKATRDSGDRSARSLSSYGAGLRRWRGRGGVEIASWWQSDRPAHVSPDSRDPAAHGGTRGAALPSMCPLCLPRLAPSSPRVSAPVRITDDVAQMSPLPQQS